MRQRKRRQRREEHRAHEQARRHGPRLPGELQSAFGNIGLELARRALVERRWQRAIDYAETAREIDPGAADAVIAEACARLARRRALYGDFAAADRYAKRALDLRPSNPDYQARRRLIAEAKAAVLRDRDLPLFARSAGIVRTNWWEQDLLARVRGLDGSRETVPPPLILQDVKPKSLAGVYAVGTYVPRWSGTQPLFSQYILSLKKSGTTTTVAAILLRQGLVEEVEDEWVEEIGVIVPMPTSLRSFEERGFELTEELATELGRLLCVPVVDAFERDPEAERTRSHGGYRARREAVEGALKLKKTHASLLHAAEAVLVVDDVITTGASLETCAKVLCGAYPQLTVYGAALACTESPMRRARAERAPPPEAPSSV